MVALLIQNQVQSAFGAEQAGLLNHALDPNVVVAAEGAMLARWYGIVGKEIASVGALEGKRLGIARGSGSEVFWLAAVNKLKLDPKDYKIVQVEAPEMVAALERGDIDAYSAWEPWLTRGAAAVKGARLVVDNVGIIEGRVFIYVNKDWAVKSRTAAVSFMRSMVEATDVINTKRDQAAADVAKFLKLDLPLTKLLMDKLSFDVPSGPAIHRQLPDRRSSVEEHWQASQAGVLEHPVLSRSAPRSGTEQGELQAARRLIGRVDASEIVEGRPGIAGHGIGQFGECLCDHAMGAPHEPARRQTGKAHLAGKDSLGYLAVALE